MNFIQTKDGVLLHGEPDREAEFTHELLREGLPEFITYQPEFSRLTFTVANARLTYRIESKSDKALYGRLVVWIEIADGKEGAVKYP